VAGCWLERCRGPSQPHRQLLGRSQWDVGEPDAALSLLPLPLRRVLVSRRSIKDGPLTVVQRREGNSSGAHTSGSATAASIASSLTIFTRCFESTRGTVNPRRLNRLSPRFLLVRLFFACLLSAGCLFVGRQSL
jgi:hypothetical protein